MSDRSSRVPVTFEPFVEINARFDPWHCCATCVDYGEDAKLAVLCREETNNELDMYLVLWDQEREQGLTDCVRRGRRSDARKRGQGQRLDQSHQSATIHLPNPRSNVLE
jgi:hypothetical protein